MKVRVKENVKTSTSAEVVFVCAVAGILTSIAFGPVAGILAAAGGFACGYPVAMRDRRREADRYISNYMSDKDLYEAMRHGSRKVTKTTELKNIHSGQPPLGRLVFGDKLTKETTYYLEDD